MRDATLPILLILLGVAWLLRSLGLMPEVHWLWILGLTGSGIAILVMDGITKSSVVAGPLLILGGILSFLHEYYALGWRIMIPVMMIAAGLLMLVARSPTVPQSRRFRTSPADIDREPHG